MLPDIFVLWLCPKYTSDSFFFVVSVSLPYVSQQWWREGGTTWVHLHKESKKKIDRWTVDWAEWRYQLWCSSVSHRHTVTVFTQFFFFFNFTHLFYSCSPCVPQIHLLTEDTETVKWIQNNLRLREVEKEKHVLLSRSQQSNFDFVNVLSGHYYNCTYY